MEIGYSDLPELSSMLMIICAGRFSLHTVQAYSEREREGGGERER